MSPYTLFLAAVSVACCYVIYTIYIANLLSPHAGLPRPKQKLLPLRIFHEPTAFEITQWVRSIPNDGFIRYFGLMNQERLIITTIEAHKELLLRDGIKYHKLAAISAVQWPVGASGLVSSEGMLHKVHRRQILAAFNVTWARSVCPKAWQTAREACDSLAAKASAASGRVVPMNSFLRTVCLDMVSRISFSLDLGALANPDWDVTKSYLRGFGLSENTPLFLKLLQLCPDPLKIYSSILVSNIILGVNISGMDALIRATVSSKLKALEGLKADSSEAKDLDLIDRICLRGQPLLSERALVRHALTTMAASVEMVSNELSWATYALSLPQHQKIQDKLRDEIRDRFAQSPETITASDIASFPYLNGVVNEVLRLYPSVAHRFRVCKTPTTLLGREIRKQTLVVFPIHTMNRHPDLWGPDSDEFRPERWMGDAAQDDTADPRRDAYAFMTFGQGLRKCPGENYARIVIACMILGLVGRFRLTLPPGGDVLADGAKKVGFGVVAKALIDVRVEEVPGWH